MFQPAILTVQSVFKELIEIADISGLRSRNRKVDMTVRIGMSEESVLQALAQAVVQTPLCQDYPPEFHTAYWSENIQS